MGLRGQLNIDEAFVIGMDIRAITGQLDYIAVHLESESFVGLLGSNRIRLVFEGCERAEFHLQTCPPSRERISSFYVKTDSPMLHAKHYCLQFEHSNSSLNIVARVLQVEIEPSTMRQN